MQHKILVGIPQVQWTVSNFLTHHVILQITIWPIKIYTELNITIIKYQNNKSKQTSYHFAESGDFFFFYKEKRKKIAAEVIGEIRWKIFLNISKLMATAGSRKLVKNETASGKYFDVLFGIAKNSRVQRWNSAVLMNASRRSRTGVIINSVKRR